MDKETEERSAARDPERPNKNVTDEEVRQELVDEVGKTPQRAEGDDAPAQRRPIEDPGKTPGAAEGDIDPRDDLASRH
ncbi:MAG TPA: hypothetical protein VEY30_03305 [Myxococcaceae bacterium]|nr:hypothetical protein [Myxococcaceae bacterium]